MRNNFLITISAITAGIAAGCSDLSFRAKYLTFLILIAIAGVAWLIVKAMGDLRATKVKEEAQEKRLHVGAHGFFWE